MKAAGWGRIVNISSSSAQTGSGQHGALFLVQGRHHHAHPHMAQELGPLGITVNNIPPGSVMNTSCPKPPGPPG